MNAVPMSLSHRCVRVLYDFSSTQSTNSLSPARSAVASKTLSSSLPTSVPDHQQLPSPLSTVVVFVTVPLPTSSRKKVSPCAEPTYDQHNRLCLLRKRSMRTGWRDNGVLGRREELVGSLRGRWGWELEGVA